MAYKLLGMVVWKAARLFLRRKYGTTMAPKSMLAGGLLLVIAGIVLAALRSRNGDS
jgi:ABC-type Fe3+-siderophore transport system permease subunit